MLCDHFVGAHIPHYYIFEKKYSEDAEYVYFLFLYSEFSRFTINTEFMLYVCLYVCMYICTLGA